MVEHGATPDMVMYCFDTLIAALKNNGTPRVPSSVPNDRL